MEGDQDCKLNWAAMLPNSSKAITDFGVGQCIHLCILVLHFHDSILKFQPSLSTCNRFQMFARWLQCLSLVTVKRGRQQEHQPVLPLSSRTEKFTTICLQKQMFTKILGDQSSQQSLSKGLHCNNTGWDLTWNCTVTVL